MGWALVTMWAKDRNGNWIKLEEIQTDQPVRASVAYDTQSWRFQMGPQAVRDWIHFVRPDLDATEAVLTVHIWKQKSDGGMAWFRQDEKTVAASPLPLARGVNVPDFKFSRR